MTWEELELGWQIAFSKAWDAFCSNTIPIGAAILNEHNELVSCGQNMIFTEKSEEPVIYGSSIAHAEINAIVRLKNKEHPNIRSYTLYTTTEPCILCFGAIVMGNIRHCKFAARDRYAGAVAYNEHSSYVKSKNIKFDGPHEELEAVQIAMSVYYELNKNLANCEYLISHMALDCPKGVSVEGNPHEYKIIVTTIQKLDIFIRKNKQHDIYKKQVVLIFDECHRSQFGEMHRAITKSFKKYHIFGFTGTPIFAANASSGGNPLLRTTEQAFGEKLHTYTIVDAINDGNVLPFRIDFTDTIKIADHIKDKKVYSIDREKALADPRRISEIVSYVLEHFDQKTKRNSYYTFSAKWEEADKCNPKKIIEKRELRRVAGFNSIFAAASIPMAMKYYNEFKKQIAEKNSNLIIATIFSFSANEEEPDGLLPEEDFNIDNLDQSSRDFLEAAIRDYNTTFNTNFDTSSDKFQNYYKDLSLRVKNREIDILIVVNMFHA